MSPGKRPRSSADLGPEPASSSWTRLCEVAADITRYAAVSLRPGGLLIESVAELSARIHRDFAYVPGFTSVTTPLSVVLEHRRGVCQDFAHLAVACLRGRPVQPNSTCCKDPLNFLSLPATGLPCDYKEGHGICASAMTFGRVWKVGVHMQRWKRSLEGTAGLVLAIAFLGCGLTVKQQAAIDQFSAATSDFATVGRSEFQQSRADVTEMNTRRLELGDDSVPGNLDGLLTIERTMARLAALEALQEYAQLLGALVSTTLPR
jgi:transglutaminase superfamily protein